MAEWKTLGGVASRASRTSFAFPSSKVKHFLDLCLPLFLSREESTDTYPYLSLPYFSAAPFVLLYSLLLNVLCSFLWNTAVQKSGRKQKATMALRQLIIERSSVRGKKIRARIQVIVDDRVAIGPCVITFAARLGYPLVDSFGSPVAYRLRSVSGAYVLPTTGRFADARFPSGCQFILESDVYRTVSMQKHACEALQAHDPTSSLRFSRRSLMNTGLLTAFSLLGFGSGMTTAFAQRLLNQGHLNQRQGAAAPVSVHTLFRQHRQTVRTVTWAPDESMVASGGNDGIALVWRLDGTVLHMLQFNAPVRALAWSPDGEQIVAGAANTVSFFDVHTGSLLAENAEQHTASVTSLGWTSAQGTVSFALSAGIDKKAIVWSEQLHQPQVVFRQHSSAIEALAALGNSVVTASEGGLVRVWSALSGQEIHGSYSDTQQPLRAVAISSKGCLATAGNDGIVHLWRDGRTCMHQVPEVFGLHCVDWVIRLQGHTRPVRALAFSPDGMKLATGGDDKKLIIWSLQTMTPLLVQPQADVLLALSWSPSGQFMAGAVGSRVALW
jgi:WD40 repeat protein